MRTFMGSLNKVGNEKNLRERYHKEISDFWQQGCFDHFIGKDHCEIAYSAFYFNNFEKNIVIVPGRAEGYLKYKELAYDLHCQQYNVFIIDHRGQGLSQRLLANPHKGHVDSFGDYVADLHTFMTQVVLSHATNQPFLLAHSMGGAIATRYLQTYPHIIKAAVLSSPMMAINTGTIPKWLALALVKSLHAINKLLGQPSWYFFGQSNYRVKPFENNPLMQSAVRYSIFSQLYDEVPKLQLGGVTIKWLLEAEKVRHLIFKELYKIKTPLMVIQAQDDIIVDNQAQDDFCAKLHRLDQKSCSGGKVSMIKNARHELFFESDQLRNEALIHAINWFEQSHHS